MPARHLARIARAARRRRPRRPGALVPHAQRQESRHGRVHDLARSGLDQQLADTALALVVEHWRHVDQDGWADTVAQFGWDAGCRHPDVAETVAAVRAAPRRATDLEAALVIVDTALAATGGSTASGWTRLEARRAQLAGLLRRAASGRPTGESDADGNPTSLLPLGEGH